MGGKLKLMSLLVHGLHGSPDSQETADLCISLEYISSVWLETAQK